MSVIGRFKTELNVYRLVLINPGTPRLARWLLGFAVGYALCPFDIIPDFIPVLGLLDDILIIPAIVILALKLVPEGVMAECREKAGQRPDPQGA